MDSINLTPTKKIPHWLPITLIMVVATGLYFYQLGTESLWTDELISIYRGKDLELIMRDSRPLYHFLLSGWIILSDNDAWLRSLGVIFSLGAVFGSYRLGYHLINQSAGLITAILVSLSPLFINHAQEVRMYAPSTCFGVWGTLILAYALENPRIWFIALWSLLRFLAIITTPLNLLILLPDVVLIACQFYRKRPVLWRFCLGLLFIGAAWSPWIISIVTRSAEFIGGVRVSSGESTTRSLKEIPSLSQILLQPGRFTAWSFGRANSSKIYWFYNAYSVMLAGLLGWSLWQWKRYEKLSWIAAWALLPLVPILLASFISRSLWVDRYLLFIAPYIFLLLAVGWLSIWQNLRIPALIVALIYTLAIAGGLKRYYTVDDRLDWRGLVHTISENEQLGDEIVWSIGQNVPVALNHYYHGSNQINIYHPPQLKTKDDPLAVEDWLANLPANQSRLWLVCLEFSPELESALAEQFEVKKHRSFKAIQLFLLKELDSEIEEGGEDG